MAEIDVERRDESPVPWWVGVLGLIVLLLIVLIVGIAAPDADVTPAGTGAGAIEEELEPEAPQPEMPAPEMEEINLQQVLEDTGLQERISYGRMDWQAVDAGRYEQDGIDLIAIGPRINGNELYYEQGTPTNPYETLYLRATGEGYEDVFVKYEPVDEGAMDQQMNGGQGMTDQNMTDQDMTDMEDMTQ